MEPQISPEKNLGENNIEERDKRNRILLIIIMAIMLAGLIVGMAFGIHSCTTAPIATSFEHAVLISSPHDLNTLIVGDTHQLSVLVTKDGDHVGVDQGVVWQTSNPELATISATGEVSAHTHGIVTFTATSVENNLVFDTHIMVIHTETVVEISEDDLDDIVLTGEKLQLQVSVTKESDPEVSQLVAWQTSNKELATIDSTGLISTHSHGIVTFTATAVDGSMAFDTYELQIGAVITGMIVAEDGRDTMNEDENLQLELVLTKPDEPNFDYSVTWFSSDEGIATVDQNGVVTAVGYGDVTITARHNETGKEYSYTIHIEAKTIVEVSTDDDTSALNVGDEIQLVAEVIKADDPGIAQDVIWTSGDDDIATVDVNGVVTITGYGEVTIKATHEESGAFDTYTIEVPVDTFVEITSAGGVTSVIEGETLQLNAEVRKEDGSPVTQDVVWVSSHEDLATIDENGSVTTKGYGDVTFTATATDGSGAFDTFTLHIEAETIIIITKGETEDGTIQLYAEVIKADDPDVSQDVIWSSDNNGIATVDQNGLVTGVTEGEVTITARGVNNSVGTIVLEVGEDSGDIILGVGDWGDGGVLGQNSNPGSKYQKIINVDRAPSMDLIEGALF